MIFFTSDLHFWHANVIKYCGRPYSSVEEMNEAMVTNWNAVVGPDDEVYCLGDFSLAIRPVELYSRRLNGRKYLVPGNHDWCHSYNKKSRKPGALAEMKKLYESHGWTILPEQTTFSIPGAANVLLCHLPYNYPDEWPNDKYEKWRIKDEGRWLLCGHVHEKWKTKGKMINVGVDVWDMKPVSIDEVSKIICSYNTI